MGRSARRHARGRDEDGTSGGAGGLPRALALTLASALVWGIAHFAAGRRIAGGLLLALYLTVAVAMAGAATVYRSDLVHLAVQPAALQRMSGGLVALGVVWILVVIRSYLVLRPARLAVGARALGAASVAVMCFAVAVPVAWSAHSTYVYRNALTSIFRSGSENGKKVDAEDPFNGEPRVNVLLLGGDAASNRTGVRTDSMTVASVDTKTGDTVLLSLPRNLESFPMPPGPARDRFPYGFTGDGPQNPGLLNEVYEYAENHPDVVPGVAKNHRGPELLKATIAGILGVRVDYYILVDMFGFADIIDAMGGVKIKITEPIPYGLQGAVLQPGDRTLSGKEALWYGRSRTNSSDYVRMSRQKCLMRAIAEQADPQTVLRSFDKLAAAAKRTLSTDIPQELLPALVKLSNKVKNGAQIRSLQFVPPLIYTGNPDFDKIRKLTSEAVNSDPRQVSAKPSGTPGGTPGTTPTQSPDSPDGSESPKPDSKPVSLKSSCP
ncbi:MULTISPECIES: LCP family protein [Actinomadura]|uniref:Cell envelope-related function transcriptional attenuator common domain-containing protein n=1 Tax=Actinomadura madurae TaxID=1993 RepID=A0A1I5H585_9ACTN|nr:LCP family protein [Actinomadura madurae]SFO43377.1 cell envelope-related function transcriptional attenuator common domain-containing protein [Actinomadura madurae]SPT57545.1 Putative transcriptional regulator ywtF [Actinomadura madurae]